MNVLGITLARGGSKGIPKKNIKTINGKPLIAWTIEAALESSVFTHYIVSTDSEEIASVSRKYGASVPFIRPSELAEDHVWSRDALKHAVLSAEKYYGIVYDFVVELPCVAPLRTSNNIIGAVNKLIKTGADSVISLKSVRDGHPIRMKRIIDGQIRDFTTEFPEGEGQRRQDFEPCFSRNGAIFAMTRECIVDKFSRYGNDCRPYVMSEESSVDIDTMLDFKIAEFLLRERNDQ